MEEKTIVFEPIDDLLYDIDEIDHSLYMFSHDCVGCVMLSLSSEISKEGKVYLEGKEHTKWKLIRTNNYPHQLLVVYLRGIICEYDTKAKLDIEGFCGVDGAEMKPQSFKIKVLPRRNDYSKKYQAQYELAFRAAAESMVLLKNDGTLPLKKNAKLALFGSGLVNYRLSPTGAGRINPRCRRSILQAIDETSNFSYDLSLAEFYRIPNDNIPDDKQLLNAANNCDVAVIIITRGTGENIDNRPLREEYYLSVEEENLINKISKLFNKCIVILNVSYPIDVRFLDNSNINAAVYSGLSGMAATDALVSILDGRNSPCGHLPDTWPVDYFDAPSSVNFLNFTEVTDRALQTDDPIWSQICYEEGLYVGYRYFSSFNKKVSFPFGYGLSYTTFELNPVGFTTENKEIRFTVNAKNIGNCAGKEVVQLYVSKPGSRLEQPKYELVAFEKTEKLSVGEEVSLNLTVSFEELKSYDEEDATWKLLKGEYSFYYGENVDSVSFAGKIGFDKDEILKCVKNRVCPKIKFDELTMLNASISHKNTGIFERRTFADTVVDNADIELQNVPKDIVYFNSVIKNPDRATEFVQQFTDDELCRFNVCLTNGWNMDAKGEAGWTVGIKRLGLPSFSLVDGNNGVNIKMPNIGMPTSSMIAGSFDKKLAYEVGCAIGKTAYENGASILLAPAMNLHRNLLCGRNAEYFSEDPLLTGTMAGYQNKGFQDTGICGCIKHVAANNCEALRKRSDSIIKERTLRELYLRPFEYAMQIEPSDTIMTGYNALNEVFCDENPELIEGIFREEFGFDGFAMSDWNSYDTSDMCTMVKAGISLLTPGCSDDSRVKPLRDALKSGELTRATLVRNAARIVRVLAKRKGLCGFIVKDYEDI